VKTPRRPVSAACLAVVLLAGPARGQELHLATAPGESLHAVSVGTGDPVVLVPGLFGCVFGFRHLTAALPRLGYRTIVIEPLAIGSSSRPPKADYSLTAQADRLAAAIRKIERRPVLLVAHSAAGSMALRLAVRHPTLVSGVVLLDAGPMETLGTKGFRRAMTYVPWVKWLGGMKRLRPRIRRDLIASSADSAWVTDQVLAEYTAGAAADLDGTLNAYLRMAKVREPEKLAPRLNQMAVPVRLLVGTAPHKEGISGEQVALLRKSIRQFAVDSVPGAGHYLQEEKPEAVIAAIRRAHPSALVLSRAAGGRP